MNHLNAILSEFNSVSLEETADVKLMDRIDRKYWFHVSQLNELLKKSLPFYSILEINGERLMQYETIYFDTPEDKMYLTHHNQKLNRYKVRRRNYVTSGIGFFEVKLKNNRRRTVKQRIETNAKSHGISETETDFLRSTAPFKDEFLRPVLKNQFNRLTLIHKEKKDRCTIDIQPVFRNEFGEVCLDELVVFELKRGQSMQASPMVALLREMKIRQRGLSKYCTGRAILEPELKRNSFKPRLRFLHREILTGTKNRSSKYIQN